MTSLSGHIDTMRPLLLPQKKQFAATSEVFPLHDGDFLTLHYLQPTSPQPQGLLLILPGMASNRNAPVIMAATRTLLTQNFSPVIAELRNCSDVPGKTQKFFNAGSVADLTELVDYLCEKTGRPLSAIIGFSLGANILMQWAARNTNARQQTHFIHCISLPLDLRMTAEAADQGFNRIYQKRIIARHRQLLKRRHDPASLLILPRLDGIKRMHDFDEQVTVPLNGYRSLNQYYEENSALQYINDVDIHCRITNSLNDPLIPDSGLYSGIHRRLGLELNIVPYGGHLGLLHTSIFRKAKHFFTSDFNLTETLL